MAPFYGLSSTASRLESLRGGSLLFTTKFQEIPGTHFIDLGRKDERLSRPWSYPVVLDTGSLEWEFRALTTRPLVHKETKWLLKKHKMVTKKWLLKNTKQHLNLKESCNEVGLKMFMQFLFDFLLYI